MTLRTRPRQRLTLAVACTAQVMMVLDVMIVSVALPYLQRELHLSPAGLLAGAILVAAAVVGFLGLRHLGSPPHEGGNARRRCPALRSRTGTRSAPASSR